MTEPSPPASGSKLRMLGESCLLPGIVLSAELAAFMLARLALRALYPGDFGALPLSSQAAAFLRGFRYDLSVTSPTLGLPLLLLLMPLGGAMGRRWRLVWGWASFVLVAATSLALACDVAYFGVVHRHAGLELLAPGEVAMAIASAAVHVYLLPLLVFAGFVGVLGLGWNRLLRRTPPPPLSIGARCALALAALLFLYYGERGTLWGKRLRVVHAFEGLPEPAAQLALNGPYCILHTLMHSRPVRTAFYPWEKALQTAREALFAPGEHAEGPDYPLLRRRTAGTLGRPNVVLIMLESWDAREVDAHRRRMGLPDRGLTPSYDALSREGLLFSRFYASGQRSMDGMSALLCGFPTLPGTPYLGQGLEQNKLTSLGKLARKEGYETWFIQSSERDSFRCDAIASRLGFDHYLGAEDIPAEPPGRPRGVLRGACWDHEMFAEAAGKLSAARRPFLAFLYTNSTHFPYFWPEDRWKKGSGDGLETRYSSSLAYADWALGRFFESAKAAGWFGRTVFLITADHVGGPGTEVSPEHPESKHHIPCLVLAPGLAPGTDSRIGSQLDVIPTLEALAGWSSAQAALGCSLLSDPASGRGAFLVEGDLVLRFEDRGFVVHDLSARVAGAAGPGGDLGAIEQRLLALAQTAYGLLRANRISR